MRDKYGTGPDPYCYPGTEILRNLHDLRDGAALSELEHRLTNEAVKQIEFEPPPYDLSSLQRIHRTLFAGIYEWAGQIRTLDIRKNDTFFCRVNRIERQRPPNCFVAWLMPIGSRRWKGPRSCLL